MDLRPEIELNKVIYYKIEISNLINFNFHLNEEMGY